MTVSPGPYDSFRGVITLTFRRMVRLPSGVRPALKSSKHHCDADQNRAGKIAPNLHESIGCCKNEKEK